MKLTRTTPAADGTALAYGVQGEGPALVFTNGFTTSTFYWAPVLHRFQGRARMVAWDLKGHGDSGPARDLEATSIPACADDLRRVMDAAGVDKAVLLAFSLGCQIVLEAWRHFPDRIAAIVPALGSFERPFDTLIHPRVGPLLHRLVSRIGPRQARAALQLGAIGGRSPLSHRLNQLAGMVGSQTHHTQMAPFYDNMARIDPATWQAMAIRAQHHSADDLLQQIRVPVLVITGGKDTVTPPERGRAVAARVPDAALLHLEAATHTGLFDESDAIVEGIDTFLCSRGLVRPPAP